ncbi:hypothetical protein P2Q00_49620 [Streptomyces coacervatus]|uniref:hypothetical protein n=1 Tax=Streptomyces coacervatus TaxID=647381 RepID=UPI0023DAB2E9|nr:hypothetical protein [Streptomyces coacervatus]MDF2273392.1 hypothetical protein [Streptomyces coacervatus]
MAERELEPHCGQVLIAELLARLFKDRLLYVHGIGWHVWDGCRWTPDKDGAAQRAVMTTVKDAPSGIACRIAAADASGHWHSSSVAYRDALGFDHLKIEHQSSCPVLHGTVSGIPDTLCAPRNRWVPVILVSGEGGSRQ